MRKIAKELLVRNASQALDAELADPEAANRFADQTIRQLVSLSERPDFHAATTELLLETLVMVWGAFENFVTEAIRVQINSEPRFGVELLSNNRRKSTFHIEGSL